MRSPFETVLETDVDEGWLYHDRESLADFNSHDVEDPTEDEDLLELRTDPNAYAFLSAAEYDLVDRRYGLSGESESMREIARDLGMTRNEAKEILSGALSKIRDNLNAV